VKRFSRFRPSASTNLPYDEPSAEDVRDVIVGDPTTKTAKLGTLLLELASAWGGALLLELASAFGEGRCWS
jgi:hypothetical protein